MPPTPRLRTAVAAAYQKKAFDRWEIAVDPGSLPPPEPIIYSKDPRHACPILNVTRVIAASNRSHALIGWIDNTCYTLTIIPDTNLVYDLDFIRMTQVEIDLTAEPWMPVEATIKVAPSQIKVRASLELKSDGALTISSCF